MVELQIREIKRETEKAICVTSDAAGLNEKFNRDIWFPKSQIEIVTLQVGPYAGDTVLTIPFWLAREKGIQ